MATKMLHPLVKAHADAVANYDVTASAACKAAATRKVAACELELTIADVPFEPWSGPARKSRGGKPDSEILTRLAAVERVAAGENYLPSVRHTATVEAKRLRLLLVKRGVTLPAPETTPATPERRAK
jgi:hypothetical protein